MPLIKSIALTFMMLVFSIAIQAGEARELFLENESWADIRLEAKGTERTSTTNYHFDMASMLVSVSGVVKSPFHIVGVKVGLAYQDTKQDWEVYGLSPLHELNLTVQPGEDKHLGGFQTSMQKGKDISGKQHWVIMQFTVRDEKEGTVFFYAHEPQE